MFGNDHSDRVRDEAGGNLVDRAAHRGADDCAGLPGIDLGEAITQFGEAGVDGPQLAQCLLATGLIDGEDLQLDFADARLGAGNAGSDLAFRTHHAREFAVSGIELRGLDQALASEFAHAGALFAHEDQFVLEGRVLVVEASNFFAQLGDL